MKLIERLTFIGCTLFTVNTFASLQTDLDKMLTPYSNISHIGIIIRQAGSGKIIYNRLQNYLFPPASIQKVLTATAALSYLGPNFTYKTRLWLEGPIVNHVVNGNITFQFSGDPELKYADLQQLASNLKSHGIQQIRGNINIDTSTYDNIPYPPGWLWDDLSYSYAAPLFSTILNKNKFSLSLTPLKVGQRPALNVYLPPNIVHFTNMVTTIAQANHFCPTTIYSDADNHYVISGCINKAAGPQGRVLALRDPLPLVKSLILRTLARDHVSFTGKMEVHNVGAHPTLLAEHVSAPLSKLLTTMLKRSDNLITNSLLKQLGYQYFHQQGTWQSGLMALQAVLAKPTGMNFKYNLINDGAGLSRYNLITPYQMSSILEYIYNTPKLREVLIDALPIAGNDGTLRNRMFNEAKEKRIHAKTGSITGVSTLAGYVFTRHLGVVTFVIMVNGFVGKRYPYLRLEDQICEYLARYQGDKNG